MAIAPGSTFSFATGKWTPPKTPATKSTKATTTSKAASTATSGDFYDTQTGRLTAAGKAKGLPEVNPLPKEPTVKQPKQKAVDTTVDTGAAAPAAKETAAPSKSIQPGSQGTEVSQLQQFLSSQINPNTGQPYLSQAQIATGSGIYGPATRAAVAEMQKTLGVDTSKGGAGVYGPQTSAMAQKYQGHFDAVKGTQAPGSKAEADAAITAGTKPSSDMVANSLAGNTDALFGIVAQTLANINDPNVSHLSLQQEYDQLSSQYGLPKMQTDLMNMQRIMNGTEDDIRDEVSKTGGTATESQVAAISASRNKVLLKQYNALATSYQAAQSNVDNLMKYASTDQQMMLDRQKTTASIAETLANMGMTMQNHSVDTYNKTLTGLGYNYTAFASTIPENMKAHVENIMGFAPGMLSNQAALAALTSSSYKQQQLAAQAQKIQISVQNAGTLASMREASTASRWTTVMNNTIRQMYPTNKNPLQIYNSSAQVIGRIDAALLQATDPKNKNKAAADLDLVDSYVQIARGGQAITEAQVATLLGGLGISARFDVATQKISGTGILNDGTRNSVAKLAKDIVGNQKKLANQAVTDVNTRLKKVSGFPSDMLMGSPEDYGAMTGGDSETYVLNGVNYTLGSDGLYYPQ